MLRRQCAIIAAVRRRARTATDHSVSKSETLTRVLLTGAAGRIGKAFREDASDRYWFRLADRTRVVLANRPSDPQGEVLELDVANLNACQSACKGIDVVLHLAADPNPDADFYGSLLDANIKGAFNIFRAAKDQGCRRVVFASSAQAVEGYPIDRQVMMDTPVRPRNLYGVTKCFGEALASYFAHVEGLSSIAVRIGNYADFERGQEHTARDMSAFLSRRDAVQLLSRCIDVEKMPFAIVHGISNNRFKRLDITDARDRLGYDPLDDAFSILGIELNDESRE